jgi:hypothetical protein
LWNEVQELLLHTKGKISYSQMAAHLGGIVSAQSIMKLLKKQKGFRTRRDHILPHLDNAAKLRCVVWAQSFYVFLAIIGSSPRSKIKVCTGTHGSEMVLRHQNMDKLQSVDFNRT